MPKTEALLQVQNLTKTFPVRSQQLYALDDVSLTLERGNVLGIIGESGCGKSTLSRCIVSLHRPTAGQILLDGEDITALRGKEKKRMHRRVQMIFQDPYSSLNPRRTVQQTVGEPFAIHGIAPDGMSREEKVASLLQDVGLDRYHLHRYPHEFSGGQRQRINIARALAMEPDILICDEPVSALDVSMQAQVLNLFLALQQEYALTYIFISHDLSVVRYISDTIAVMYLGHVVELCKAGDIYTSPLHPYTRSLLSAIPPSSPFEKKELAALPGDIPSPIGRQRGCPLARRCPHCKARCREERPPLRNAEEGHAVACFLYGEG